MAAGGRFRVASDMGPGAAQIQRNQAPISKALFIWALLLSTLLVLPWSTQVAAWTGDALFRVSTVAADFMKMSNERIRVVRGVPIPTAVPAAATGAAPAAASSVRPASAQTANAAARQPAASVPVNASVPQPTAVTNQTIAPAPTNAPATSARPQQTARPTTAPTAAPTIAPTAAPTTAPTSIPVANTSVALPAAPAAYTVPANALRVTTTAELSSALARSAATDIVLADGTYDSGGPFINANGHRIYAARLGGSVLKAGLVMGGNYGPGNGLVQGLAFDVADPSKTLLSSVIHVWGTGAGTRIADVTINGNNAVDSGINIRNPEGSVVRRVQLRNFKSYGLIADTGAQNKNLAAPILLEDIDVSGVSRAVPKSSNGTAEACIWLGNTGTLRRARVSDCSWMGIWTGTSNHDALHEDITVDRTMVGVYLEHFTTNSTFQRMRIGPNVVHGLVCEWADPAWGSRPGCTNDVIQDSTFMSSDVGVLLDNGTTGTVVRRVTFIGQARAAIYDPRGNGNDYYDNDYSRIDSTAVPVEDSFLSF
jgi:hypothetical protein